MNIKEAIEQQSEMRGRFGANVMDWFLLRNGSEFKPIAHSEKMGAMKECFTNATHFVIDADLDAGYRYCEGYAIRPGLGILIHHAWVLDADDNVIDLTWRDAGDCLYWGVPFDLDTLLSELNTNLVYGLLDIGMINVRLMQEIDGETNDYLKRCTYSRKQWMEEQKEILSR